MEPWLLYVTVTFILWGVGGILSKLAVNYVGPESSFIYQVMGALIVGMAAYAFLGFRMGMDARGAFWGISYGALAMLGGLFYLLAVNKGSVSIVTTISGLYPVVTIVLALLLFREPVTLKQGFGMLMALAAIALMST